MYFYHLLLALVLYVAIIDDAEGKAFRKDYVYYPSAHSWVKLHRTPADWRSVRFTCFDEGAVLASPENEDLLTAMSTAMLVNSLSSSYVFTGIHDTFSKGIFNSLEGTPLDQMPVPWDKPDPNYDENCWIMHQNGELKISKCTEKLPFICYKKVPPTPPNFTCGPKDNGYNLVAATNSCYKFHNKFVYWHQAFATCAREGAHLAIINSNKEAELLANYFKDIYFFKLINDKGIIRDVVHVGFVDWGRQGGLWMTIHGQTLKEAGFDKWDPNEPNNRTNQFCGGLYQSAGLDDVNCADGDIDKAARAFICERKPEVTQETPMSDNIDLRQP